MRHLDKKVWGNTLHGVHLYLPCEFVCVCVIVYSHKQKPLLSRGMNGMEPEG